MKLIATLSLALLLTACDMNDEQKVYCLPTGATNIKILRDNASNGEVAFDLNSKHYRLWWYARSGASFIIEEK